MPIYSYGCSNCETLFETILKMSEMELPLSEPCPECGVAGNITQMVTAANFGDPVRMGRVKPDAGWNDVLSKVKSAHPKGNWGNKKFVPRQGR